MKLRQLYIVGITIFIVVGSLGLSQYLASLKEPPQIKQPPEFKKYVKTTTVKYGMVPTEVIAFGRVKTAQSLDIIAEVSGQMSKGSVLLKEGQRFKQGTLLYKIDDTESRLNLQSQKSNFLKDLAAILPDLKIDFNDNYTAWDQYFQSINLEETLPELPEYKTTKEKTFLATKGIFSSYYSIKSAEANLRKYYFYAPFDGVISIVNLQSGSYVNPGNKIGTILRSDALELKVDVETKDIEWINLGEEVTVETESGNSWKGKITRIGEFVNPNTQSIDVFISIYKKDKPLYDGQYLKSVIPTKTIQNAMEIPRAAIFNNNEVFLLQDTLLKVSEINILRLTQESVIFNGLEENSEVVVEPLIDAHNNMRAFKLEEREKDINVEEKNNKGKLVKN